MISLLAAADGGDALGTVFLQCNDKDRSIGLPHFSQSFSLFSKFFEVLSKGFIT